MTYTLHDGIFLKQYIENKPIRVTSVVKTTGIKRATIYTHFNKQKLDVSIKDKYSESIGIVWPGQQEDQNRHKVDGESDINQKEKVNLSLKNQRDNIVTNEFNPPENQLINNSVQNTRQNNLVDSSVTSANLDVPNNQNQLNRANAKDIGYIDYEDERGVVPIGPGRYLLKVPLVPEYAYAGYLNGYSDSEYLNELPMHEVIVSVIPKGTYRAFEVVGDSMDDDSKRSIPHGSKVTGREIKPHLWRSKLHNHKWPNWIFVHRTEGIICKQIAHQDVEKGILTLRSLNTDKDAYPDFTLNLEDVVQIFNIVKREFPD